MVFIPAEQQELRQAAGRWTIAFTRALHAHLQVRRAFSALGLDNGWSGNGRLHGKQVFWGCTRQVQRGFWERDQGGLGGERAGEGAHAKEPALRAAQSGGSLRPWSTPPPHPPVCCCFPQEGVDVRQTLKNVLSPAELDMLCGSQHRVVKSLSILAEIIKQVRV